jgi:rhodanese-related sulfurtransferase
MNSKSKIIVSTFLMVIGILLGILNQTDTVPANTEINIENNLNSISLSEWKNIYDNEKDYIVIDVRTQKEYNNQKIPNTKLINFYDTDFKDQLNQLDKNKKYLIHCRSGSRSANALSVMKELGFTNVQDLKGGINAWNSAGYPTE